MTARQLAEDLASRLNLRERKRSWGGNCPSCSYRGAFSIKVSPKFARPLLYCANGCTREQLSAEAERVLMSSWGPPPAVDEADKAEGRAKKQGAALKLFAGAACVTQNDPAGFYLTTRGLADLIGCPALGYRADCWHPEGGRLRAMVAQVVDVAGRPIAVHRTYLAQDGRKAAVDPPKASLGPIWGGAVRLNPVAPELVIGEGIESAASAGVFLGLSAWAAISAGNLAGGWCCRRGCAASQSRAIMTSPAAELPTMRRGAGERRVGPCAWQCQTRQGRTSTTCCGSNVVADGAGFTFSEPGATTAAGIWIDAEHWEEQAIRARDWVAPAYLLRGQVTAVIGPPGVSKSMLMVAYAVALALNIPLHGMRPCRAARVMIYNAEDDQDEQRRRLSAILTSHGERPERVANKIVRIGPMGPATLLTRDPDTQDLRPTPAMAELRDAINAFRPDVLILDSALGAALGRRERQRRDAGGGGRVPEAGQGVQPRLGAGAPHGDLE